MILKKNTQFKYAKIHSRFSFFNSGKTRFIFLILIVSMILSGCSTVYASEEIPDRDDIYIVRGKMTVIYKGAAPDAEEDIQSEKEHDVSAGHPQELSVKEGAVSIDADTMDYDHVRDVYHAKGKVVIVYSGSALSADEVELDNKNNLATAQGGALLKMNEDTLRGEKIVVNIEDKTGAAYKANAFYARNNFHVKGDKIAKTGADTYFIEKPYATTCDGESPDWSIAGSEMKVTIEGYGLMKNARFCVKDLPVLYAPYLPFPAKTKRQSGLLLPYLAYSRDKDGIDVMLPFFWAISEQMDATFYQRYIEKRGFKEGVEFRYYLGEKSFGTFYGDYMEDTKDVIEATDPAIGRNWQEMHKRWSYYFNHQTYIDPQFYIRTDLRKASDKWYFKDFHAQNYYLDNYAENAQDVFKNVSFRGDESLRYLESTIRMYKGWSNYNISAVVNSTEDFAAADNDQTLQRYPEIVLSGVKQQVLSTPLYFEFTGAYDYLYRTGGEKGHFVDFSPTLSLPLNVFNYLRITPQFAFKETFWSRDDNQTDTREKTRDRTIYNASISLSSQISRVFDVNVMGWEKVRHEIKPEILYSYVPHVSADHVPDYYLPASWPFMMPVTTLSTDILTEQNGVAWALTNTLTARAKEGDSFNYLEFLRLKLFQTYDIYEANRDMTGSTLERRPFSDMGMELDLTPHKYFSFKSRNLYSFYDGWKQNNLEMNLKDWRGDSLLIGYRYTVDSIEEINVGLKALITSNVEGALVSKYDLLKSRKIENSIGFIYRSQCWSMGFDVTETDDDVRFMFKVSLAGLGNIGAK